METVRFSTKDGIEIVGDYYAATISSGIILLHMMPADRSSWRALAGKVQQEGISVLAIDLRGHGQSSGGPMGYRAFSDSDHEKSIFDIEASVEFLHAKGVTTFHIGGASIGANLSLQYAAQHQKIASVFLLSPGLDYHGIHADIWMDNMKPDQRVLLAASDDDVYSLTTVKALVDRSKNLPKRDLRILGNAGHGTAMFEKNPQFIDELAVWIKKADQGVSQK